MRPRFILILLAALAPAAAEGGQANPLFESNDVIDIAITAPVDEIAAKAERSTKSHAGSLSHGGETLAIELSARGNARRKSSACRFPPLRVKFETPPPAGSLFEGQKSLKLVTHCRSDDSFQQHTLLEYTAYRMLNVLTEEGFRVRLARVSYSDPASSRLVIPRFGFFIEDVDDLAARVGMAEVKVSKVSLAQHVPEAAARGALFNHMIANHDWSMMRGPEGENCCHNGKLLGANEAATGGLVYVPYDFDFSGFVDAPYASPPPEIRIKSVRTRSYRGHCALNAAAVLEARRFRARKSEILGAVDATPGLTPKTIAEARAYLGAFFAEIADDAAVTKLTKRCR
jgi:hypothetical protein